MATSISKIYLKKKGHFFFNISSYIFSIIIDFFSIIIDFFSIIIDFFSIFFFNLIETNIELFFNNIIDFFFNNEAVSIRIETGPGLKKFNPRTLRVSCLPCSPIHV